MQIFTYAPFQKILNLSDTPTPALYEHHPSPNFEEIDSLPPLEMYPLPRKGRLIFERNKIFYFQQWNENTFERWNTNIQLQNLKINRELAFSKYFISVWWLVTDLLGLFNTDSRETISKLSGLRWFFLFLWRFIQWRGIFTSK